MGGKKKRGKGGYRQRGPDQYRTRTPDRTRVLPLFDELGGLREGTARAIHEATGMPEAEAYGVGSFYHLVARPDVEARVCDGLTCRMAGADGVLESLKAEGVKAEGAACLGQCDRAPAVLWTPTRSEEHDYRVSIGRDGPLPEPTLTPSSPDLVLDLAGDDDTTWAGLAAAREMGPEAVIAAVKESQIRGRGGAGFPAHIKWQAVAVQRAGPKHIICNADEGEPGTFKDREVMMRRPHLMLEGMAIAALAVGGTGLVIYLRGEFSAARHALEGAITAARAAGHLDGLEVEVVLGHGAYICGEETALLEALEGRRGMPRHKPPFPTESGLWGQPTLMNNVETFACIPPIVRRGGAWFAGLGRGDAAAGTKLYSISGDCARPGVYELPQGATMAELLAAAGGVVGGELLAFSPGGASSGFLPASDLDVPLDFGPLADRGSMLGSAGVVVLNDTRDMLDAAVTQARFFRDESCGQCAPCRVGTQVIVKLLERSQARGGDTGPVRKALENVAWEMDAGSICGLGMAAPMPTLHLLQHFTGPARGDS